MPACRGSAICTGNADDIAHLETAQIILQLGARPVCKGRLSNTRSNSMYNGCNRSIDVGGPNTKLSELVHETLHNVFLPIRYSCVRNKQSSAGLLRSLQGQCARVIVLCVSMSHENMIYVYVSIVSTSDNSNWDAVRKTFVGHAEANSSREYLGSKYA